MTDRSVLVRLRADVSDFVSKSQLAKAAVRDLNNEIDKSNDRTAWLAQGILALTPAVTRLGAGAVPAISGIATQMTLAVAAAGTMAIAFNGVGDALGALNDYQLDPTAENLAQLNEAMAKIGPSGRELVEYLDSIAPALAEIANSARGEMFPGIIDGLESVMELGPQVSEIVGEIGSAIGQLASETGDGLSGDRFAPFFEYLETRAKPILIEMGETLGNFGLGLANMLVEFDPLTADFSSGLLEMSRSFSAWSETFADTQGFQEFVDYVREAGPQALDFFGSLIMALVELAEAAAPVGAVMLPVLTSILDLLGDLANTPLGPIAVGFLALTSAWGRLNAVAEITGSGVLSKVTAGLRGNATAARAAVPSFRQLGNAVAFAAIPTSALAKSSMSYSQAANSSAIGALRARAAVQNFGRAAAPVAGQVGLMALAMSDVDNKMGLTNTASLTLAGSLLGPWGAAVGASAGLLLDMKAGADAATTGIKGLDEAAAAKNIELLTQRIAEAKAEMADQDKVTGFGDFFSDAMRDIGSSGSADAMKVYTDAIAEAEAELADLKNARQETWSSDTIVNDLNAETAALEKNIEAMREKRAEALRGLNAELDYKGAILDARDALKENGKNVDENTRKGQENLRALYGMAAGFNAQSDAAKDSAREVRAGRKAFVDMAVAMGMGEEKAKRLAKQLYEIPAKVAVVIGVDNETAMAHAKAIKAELASIDRSIDIYVNVRKPNMSGLGPQLTSADGSTVPGQRYPYGDKVHAMVAPGEEIVSNRHGQADKNRAALKAANRGAKLAVLHYATGGTVGETPDSDSGNGPRRRLPTWVPAETRALIQEFGNLARALRVSESALTRETQQRDDALTAFDATREAMDSIAQAATSQFSGDPFSSRQGAPRGTVGASAGGDDPINNLLADIAYGQRRGALQSDLMKAGLGGSSKEEQSALEEFMRSGATNDQIAALLANGQAQMLEDLLIQRQGVIGSVGGEAANAVLGSQLEANRIELETQTAEMREVKAEVRLLRQEEKNRESRQAQRDSDNAQKTGEFTASGVNSTASTTARHNRGKHRPKAGARG